MYLFHYGLYRSIVKHLLALVEIFRQTAAVEEWKKASANADACCMNLFI